MAATDAQTMGLSPDQLREVDKAILDYLQGGRVTPAFCRDRIVGDGVRDEITSTYCGERLRFMEGHNHVRSLGGGLYELVSDPREDLAGAQNDSKNERRQS